MMEDPNVLMRPAGFWAWNDKLEEPELRRQIQEMARQGWGSFFVFPTVGLVTEYFSDEFMSLVKASVDEAKSNGIHYWIFDEDTWPSGFAGGVVPRMSEAFRCKWLVLVPKGHRKNDDVLLAEVTSGGASYEICRRVAPLGNPFFKGASYTDLMNPDAVREFIRVTFQPYKESCGDEFGKTISGVFTDEPSYANRWGMEQDIPILPWSDGLADFFKEKKGYNIIDHLPQLFFDQGDYRKARFDFYDVASQLFIRSFTQQYFEWCDANKLIFTGHFLDEDSLRMQTMMTGDLMSHYEHMHWPGIDKLHRSVRRENGGTNAGIVTIKQLTSVTSQLGKARALSESYSAMGGQVSFVDRKWIGDWQAALGINAITHPLSWYSMRGERKRLYPANFFWQQPWWEDEKGLADYQARLCTAISEGEHLVDILVIQPLTSVWSEYSPLHAISNFAPESGYDLPFEHISQRLMEEKLDFHYGNENLMARHGSVLDGRLAVGRHSYGCVIVPPVLNLKSTTMQLLRKFVDGGGKLILVGDPPSFIDGVKTAEVFPDAAKVLTIDQAIASADRYAVQRLAITDVLTRKNAERVFVHSRRAEKSVRHFITNTDEKREIRARVRLPDSNGQPVAILDLCDGKLYQIDTNDEGFDVIFAPAGSILVIVGDEARLAEAPIPAVLNGGVSFIPFGRIPPTLLLEDLECALKEENVLLLNDFVLEMAGAETYRGPVCGAWHKRFYAAAEGTSFKATYAFQSEIDIEGCFAVLEVAENLESIRFNGNEVQPSRRQGENNSVFNPDASWKDGSFTRVSLPVIVKGRNTLVIEGRKSNNIVDQRSYDVSDWKNHRPTEAEEAYICGPFRLRQVSEGLFAIARKAVPAGRNLTVEGYPFYCGRAGYTSSFDLNVRDGQRVYVKLNGLKCASAAVRLNGISCGTLRWKPFMIDVTHTIKAGRNIIGIDAATTMVNCFGPNRRVGVKEELFSAQQNFPDMNRFADNYELFDFGLDSVAIYVCDSDSIELCPA